jgi:hypothetical protein
VRLSGAGFVLTLGHGGSKKMPSGGDISGRAKPPRCVNSWEDGNGASCGAFLFLATLAVMRGSRNLRIVRVACLLRLFRPLPFAIRPPLHSEINSGYSAEAAFAFERPRVTAFAADTRPVGILWSGGSATTRSATSSSRVFDIAILAKPQAIAAGFALSRAAARESLVATNKPRCQV